MKNTFKLIALLLLGISVVFFIGCEDEDDEAVNPLVGTWVMSNMEQSSTYYAAAAIATLGIAEGDSVTAGTMVWAQFSALGVNAEVVVAEDGTFTLNGNLPTANDTLGVAPTIIPLTDTGTWIHDETAGTFILDGGLYDLGGLLTLDDVDDPTMMTLNYQELEEDIDKVLPVAGVGYFDVLLDEISTTTLGFTKQ